MWFLVSISSSITSGFTSDHVAKVGVMVLTMLFLSIFLMISFAGNPSCTFCFLCQCLYTSLSLLKWKKHNLVTLNIYFYRLFASISYAMGNLDWWKADWDVGFGHTHSHRGFCAQGLPHGVGFTPVGSGSSWDCPFSVPLVGLIGSDTDLQVYMIWGSGSQPS